VLGQVSLYVIDDATWHRDRAAGFFRLRRSERYRLPGYVDRGLLDPHATL
jgi:hypothetical protein